MTALEKMLRDRLNRPDTTSGVDEEALWADIAGALPAAADGSTPVWWRSAGWLSGGALVLLLGVAALIWWPAADPVADRSFVEVQMENDDLPANPESTFVEVRMGNKSLKTNQSGTFVEVRTADNTLTKETPPAPSAAPSNSPSAPAPRRPDAIVKSESNTDAIKQGAAAGAVKVNKAKGDKAPVAAITNKISPESPEPSPLSVGEGPGDRRWQPRRERETFAAKAVEFLPSTTIDPVNYTSNPALNLNPTTPTPKQIKPTKTNPYHLTATTGGNLLHRQYQGNSEGPADDLNKANRAAAGLTTSLEAGYRISQHWTVATGLTYQRTISTFEHTVETDTTIAHPSPLNSGQIAAVARQRTAHNHRLRFLSVPLTVSRDWRFGDFSAGLGAGVAINWLQSATGKTINSDGLVAAYGTEQSGTAKTFVSYHLRPELSWRLGDSGRTELLLQTQANYQNLGVSPLSGVNQNGWLLSVSLGLKRSF